MFDWSMKRQRTSYAPQTQIRSRPRQPLTSSVRSLNVRTPDWELLTGLSLKDTSEILGLASQTRVPKTDVLFRLGDEAKNLLLVRSGRVRLTFPMRIGNEQKDILAEERVPGQMIGWSALIPPHRFTLQAVATTEAELLVLPGQALRQLFREKPRVGYTVLTNLAQIVGQRLTIFQTMWIRELQRGVESHRA